jgi:aryl carrier-like protein
MIRLDDLLYGTWALVAAQHTSSNQHAAIFSITRQVDGEETQRGVPLVLSTTAKAFFFVGKDRIYRTGDLAKLLPNGEVELYGRKDDQVKINGYRIELGEIENSVLETGIFETCIAIIATVLKKRQIVAFYSDINQKNDASENLLLPTDQTIQVDQVNSRLTSLPKYMIPTIWLPVSTFPLTPNGKVDRKRLRQFVEEMPDELLRQYFPHEEKLQVTDEQDHTLRLIWANLFDVPTDVIHGGTTFHSLGGDSISALNLAGVLRRVGYDIRVNDLLSAQTLQAQAKLLSDEHKIGERVDQVEDLPAYIPGQDIYDRLKELAIPDEEIEEIYPCSPGQVEFLTQGNKNEQFWQLLTLRELPSGFDFDRWIEVTKVLTLKNQILRAVYVYAEPANTETVVQVILKQPTLNLRYQSYTTEDEMKRIIDSEWERLFDPAKAFVRYTLLTNSETGDRHILIKLDHASYDGTLLHIFDDQFKALHQGLTPALSTEFRDFINHVRSTPKQPQLDYWTRLLRGRTFSYPSQANNPRICKWQVSKLGFEAGIDDIAQSAGVTAPIVFQSAYSLLLAHLSGSKHVVYDNLITGRNVLLDNPQLINGNCANFLPFYCGIDDCKPTNVLLQETQAAFWDSTENGLVSLGEIYKALGENRDTAAAKCLFCFQLFEPVLARQDHMRWIVMKMSKNTMQVNYAIQLEVTKGASPVLTLRLIRFIIYIVVSI